ncbi:PREDICTED: 4-coumarate--CoA ligase 1-like [Polistes canadensis]|uniref:4-coumarate--CoA ligase 1-like n=1 Tax=Polistes canadensis TaxID=91411 RepID=UPI000718F6B8|nr:PREDICTED: 4-coumarate--CoA ligase 1-like [Polistes canadensis]
MFMYRSLISRQMRANLFRSIDKLYYNGDHGNVRLARLISNYSSKKQIHLNEQNTHNNIVNSPCSNIHGYENVLLHEIVWQNMDKWSNKTAIECAITGKSYNYQQLRKHVDRLAMSLRKAKLLQYDTAAIILPNIPEYVIIILAAIEAGLRITTMNPMWTGTEIMKQIRDSETSAIFTNPLIYPTIKKSIENNSKIKLPIIVVNDGSGSIPSGTINLNDLMKEGIEEFSKNQKTGVNPEDDIFLLYSSGTTGLPKGVQLTHRNIVANLLQISSPEVSIGISTTETTQDTVPMVLPFFHIYALVPLICNYLRIGAKLVCLPQFSIKDYIKILENYKPTLLYLVPPIIQMMVNNEQITSRHVEHVRMIISGAAPLGIDTISKFHERVSDKVQFVQGYGMTETSPVVTLSKTAPANSVGFPVSNTQLRFVKYKDDESINVGPNEIGEIYVKGPQVMKGYYKNPQATQDTMDGDWIKTGDVGKYDELGYIYIEGRSKELIKVKGFQVAPAELENIISNLDGIADVAVIGVPHDKYGEIPKAFIVPKKGVTVNPEDVKSFVAKHVSNYKQIGHVQFINEIPKSPAGKILRKKLQNM